MNRNEAKTTLRKVLAYCPAQSVDEYTPDAWAEALDDIRLADALEAVRRIGRRDLEPGQNRYIEPGHIRAEVKRLRKERHDNHPHDPEPPAGLPTGQFIPWYRDAMRRIGDGEIIERPALERRPMPELGSLLRSVDDELD